MSKKKKGNKDKSSPPDYNYSLLMDSILKGMPLSMSYGDYSHDEPFIDRMIETITENQLPGRSMTRCSWPDAPERESVFIFGGTNRAPDGSECPPTVVLAIIDGFRERTSELHVSPESAKQLVNRLMDAISTCESMKENSDV